MTDSQGQVVFYSLSRKFVQEKKAPPKAQEVIYYSLAIGHHLGVIDCLEAKLSCPLAGFRAWIAQLPAGSTARRKLEGSIGLAKSVSTTAIPTCWPRR